MGSKASVRAAIAAVMGVALAVPQAAEASDISTVEGARAKQRQGRHLSRIERDAIRRYGGNDDHGFYGRRYGYWYRHGYYEFGGWEPGFSVSIGPGRRVYGPYGY